MKNYDKGITLLALVITVIILLILATISIQSLTNTGLFQKANEAKEKTRNAVENQAKMLNEYEEELNKYISEDIKTSVKSHIISYDLNGGEGNIENQVKLLGQTLTLTDIIPTKTDYTFLGWSTNKDATEPEYTSKASFEVDQDTTLYAIWDYNILWLYNEGDECTDITGGWENKWEDKSNGAGTDYWNRGTMQLEKATDKMILKVQSNGGYIGAILTTKNKIDLSKYSTLNVQYGKLYISDSYINHYISVSISKNGFDYYYLEKGAILSKFIKYGYNGTDKSNTILRVDISKLTEKGYVAPFILTDVNDYARCASISGEVYKVWLEK